MRRRLAVRSVAGARRRRCWRRARRCRAPRAGGPPPAPRPRPARRTRRSPAPSPSTASSRERHRQAGDLATAATQLADPHAARAGRRDVAARARGDARGDRRRRAREARGRQRGADGGDADRATHAMLRVLALDPAQRRRRAGAARDRPAPLDAHPGRPRGQGERTLQRPGGDAGRAARAGARDRRRRRLRPRAGDRDVPRRRHGGRPARPKRLRRRQPAQRAARQRIATVVTTARASSRARAARAGARPVRAGDRAARRAGGAWTARIPPLRRRSGSSTSRRACARTARTRAGDDAVRGQRALRPGERAGRGEAEGRAGREGEARPDRPGTRSRRRSASALAASRALLRRSPNFSVIFFLQLDRALALELRLLVVRVERQDLVPLADRRDRGSAAGTPASPRGRSCARSAPWRGVALQHGVLVAGLAARRLAERVVGALRGCRPSAAPSPAASALDRRVAAASRLDRPARLPRRARARLGRRARPARPAPPSAAVAAAAAVPGPEP